MPLFLQFQIGGEGYLLEAARIACILPMVEFKSIPHAPVGIVGAFDYRGSPVPVIDLSKLTLGIPAARHLSTRLILVPFDAAAQGEPTGKPGRTRLLGLIAEKATETIRRAAADFTCAGVTSHAAPYLDSVTTVAGRLLQLINVSKLLPPEQREAVFPDEGAAA
jgi:chemotaxis-related protein WspB